MTAPAIDKPSFLPTAASASFLDWLGSWPLPVTTIQALGWRGDKDRRYLPLQDDLASVAYWYQTEPHAAFPKLPDKDYLEVR